MSEGKKFVDVRYTAWNMAWADAMNVDLAALFDFQQWVMDRGVICVGES